MLARSSPICCADTPLTAIAACAPITNDDEGSGSTETGSGTRRFVASAPPAPELAPDVAGTDTVAVAVGDAGAVETGVVDAGAVGVAGAVAVGEGVAATEDSTAGFDTRALVQPVSTPIAKHSAAHPTTSATRPRGATGHPRATGPPRPAATPPQPRSEPTALATAVALPRLRSAHRRPR